MSLFFKRFLGKGRRLSRRSSGEEYREDESMDTKQYIDSAVRNL